MPMNVKLKTINTCTKKKTQYRKKKSYMDTSKKPKVENTRVNI
jgi:hypothetical protein